MSRGGKPALGSEALPGVAAGAICTCLGAVLLVLAGRSVFVLLAFPLFLAGSWLTAYGTAVGVLHYAADRLYVAACSHRQPAAHPQARAHANGLEHASELTRQMARAGDRRG